MGKIGLIKIHQILGLFRSSEKKAIALFFMILHNFLSVWPIFQGTDSLNGNLNKNSSIECTEIWPGSSLSGFLLIPIVFGGVEKIKVF